MTDMLKDASKINENIEKEEAKDKGFADFLPYLLMLTTIYGSSNNFTNERLVKLETKVDFLEKFVDKKIK